MESFKQGAAFGGEAVFLEAAVGFFGDGAFDEGGGKGGHQIAVSKVKPDFVIEGLIDSPFGPADLR
jgi:hypothetical protein